MLVTVDAGNLHRAKAADLVQTIQSKLLESRIPSALRDPKMNWVGLTQRARTIFYAEDRVDPKTLSTYENLVDGEWKGRICIRSSSNIYNQSLVASLIEVHGESFAESWAKGIVANMARKPTGVTRISFEQSLQANVIWRFRTHIITAGCWIRREPKTRRL